MLTHFLVSDDVGRSRAFCTGVLGGEALIDGEPTIVALANSWIIINTAPGSPAPGIAGTPPTQGRPHDSFSRASQSTTDRTFRRTGGRPERPRRDSRAHRRRTISRCHRKIVAGVTISRIATRRSAGIVPASSASHARSGHVNLA